MNKTGDECGATDAFEQVPVAQDLRERDQVDRLAGIPKIDQDTVDRLMGRDVKIFLINFLDAFRDGFARRDAASTRERPAPPRRYAAACGEYPAQNLWAKWEQPFRHFVPPNLGQRHFPLYEASLLSMRTVESPFIRFFFLFFFLGKTSGAFSFRFFGRSARRLRAFGFFRRFHLKIKLRGHVVMQLDRDFVFAGVFDWALKHNFVPVDFGADFVFEPVHDVLRRDGSESLAGFAGLEREDDRALPIRRASSSASFNSRASRSARFFFSLSS